jgi:hypothetical protein
LRPRPLLKLAKTQGGVVLYWTADCSSDHAVYEGQLGQWSSHVPARCTDTGADRTETLPLGSGNRYYLVVPRNASVEGSYGRNSVGDQRPRGVSVCVATQNVGFCP